MSDASGAPDRRRLAAVLGALALVVAGVVGVVAISTGSDDDTAGDDDLVVPTDPPVTTVADPAPDGDDADDDEFDEEAGEDDGKDDDDGDGGVREGDGEPIAEEPAAAEPAIDTEFEDRAERYLDRTEVVAERSGDFGEVIVRRSTVPYAELFDLDWDLPTGSVEECLGGDALLVYGSTGDETDAVVIHEFGSPSAWGASRLPVSAGEVRVVPTYAPLLPAELFVVEASGSGTATFRWGETVLDESPLVDGWAVLVREYDMAEPQLDGEQYLEPVVTVEFDGQRVELFPYQSFDAQPPDSCFPPQPPGPQLPEPGVPPDDPAVAEALIRAVHAELVDQSIDDPTRLERVLDDASGVAEAVEQMRAGSFAESAAGATYEIHEVVFTAPDEAFFEYTITAPTGTFGDRFGQAVVVDGTWRITRATICQDIQLASGTCGGPSGIPEPVRPGALSPAELDAWYVEFGPLQQQYFDALSCHPLSGCWRPSLPEPGTAPADPAAAEAAIAASLTALVDTSSPLEPELLDDPTGVVEAAAWFSDSDLTDSVSAEISEIVFTTPDEAWIEFDLIVGLSADSEPEFWGTHFGRAVVVDGSWRITRSTMCGLLALGGQVCEPAWTPEIPPG